MHEYAAAGRPREAPEREARVLDDLAAAKRKVDVFAGGLKHAAAQLWSDELHVRAQGPAAREETSRKGARRVRGRFKEERPTSLRPMRRAERRKAHAVCQGGSASVGTRSYDRSPERHIRILREPGKAGSIITGRAPVGRRRRSRPCRCCRNRAPPTRATGAADRAPAPEIDERRAVDDVSAEAGDAAAAEEAAALQRALDESKARADEARLRRRPSGEARAR